MGNRSSNKTSVDKKRPGNIHRHSWWQIFTLFFNYHGCILGCHHDYHSGCHQQGQWANIYGSSVKGHVIVQTLKGEAFLPIYIVYWPIKCTKPTQNVAKCECVLFSVTRRYRSDVRQWVTEWVSGRSLALALTLLMWLWWVRIPIEDFADVILIILWWKLTGDES